MADPGAAQPRSDPAEGSRRRLGLGWLSGAVLLAALGVLVTHLGEGQRFAALARSARPAWLAVAALLQAGTYLCAAAVWHRALRRGETPIALCRLVPLSLAKLFTDQAVPSAGVSGTLLVVRALRGLGVPQGRAVATMLTGLTAFYLAYAVAVAGAVLSLWLLGDLNRGLLVLATVMAVVAGAVPAAVLGLGERVAMRVPGRLRRVPVVRDALAALAALPPGSLWSRRLAAETIALQLGVFVLDAATLGVMLQALATPSPPPVVFASFVFASVVATLAWVPGGIGTFEGTCIALLAAHGVPLEAAAAATLLLRGFTFWLPMLPGLWLARRVTRHAPPADA